MADPSRLSLNQITVLSWDLARAVRGCAEHGIGSVGVWIDKVEEAGLAQAVRLLRDHDLEVSSVCRAGFFTDDRPAATIRAENARAVEIAHEVGAACLYIVCGGLGPDRDLAGARSRSLEGLRDLADLAGAAGVRLALEPLHPMMCADRGVVVTLDQALDLVDEIGDDTVGVAVDTYNVWWDPRLGGAIERAGDRVIGYQVCDWLVPQPHPTFGRGIPGDGVIDLRSVTTAVEATGFTGAIEVEIFNEDVWATDPDDVLTAIRSSFELV
ncbi:sugar phosphate isomerase/epimerase [Occultella glacieicola]|uniref:Sugar phosphate isomerase/epimerase n=1 Tax=Occultella glacieicola TaxID=2518684 RepID=A0ABY2E2I1_9MICO|nr:sugar phosphate isomerase/epimerase family protein [Occultella glacieicola]TDE92666.1 sugar phosphate isomerase/epimerase [Occultella glacieicola]